jgi:hypothetical protein
MAGTAGIGPWDGGLNLTSNRDLSPYLKDNELGIATNVQLTREGFIESRPGFKILDHAINEISSATYKILGSILISDQEVVVVQVKTATQTFIYYIKGDRTIYLKATFGATNNFSSVLAINQSAATIGDTIPRGIFLFDADALNACYRLEESPTFLAATPVLMSSTLKIPKSHFSFSVKDRTFLVDAKTSKIYWSALIDGCLWFDMARTTDPDDIIKAYSKATGYIQTEPSLDNTDDITAVEFLNNSFYLFKKGATFLFTFQADPEADGYLRKISNTLGAFDSTVYRNTVVVINNRGVFSVEGTEFLDLQQKLNLRFEQYIDTASPRAFITDFNGNILIGYTSGTQDFYYLLNGVNNGWTQWDFTYAAPDVLAAPGSNAYAARLSTDTGIILFTTMGGTKLVFCYLKPSQTYVGEDYALDTQARTKAAIGDNIQYNYIPKIDVQARTLLGDSVLNFKKVYRSYVRLYISDIPSNYTVSAAWKFSINYNDYMFDVTKNPTYYLYPIVQPSDSDFPGGPQVSGPVLIPPAPGTSIKTATYKRTYQIPFAQQRVREFTFQLQRPFSKLSDISLETDGNDRPIQEGFYFLLSGFWVDYDDKARI